MATNTTESSQEIYQIKVTLLGTRPAIWRRLLVPDCALKEFHDVLQAAMGWQNCHLHEFRAGDRRFGVPDPMDSYFTGGPRLVSERGARLSDLLPNVGAKADYTYDFGDSWEHRIVLEKMLAPEAELAYPVCIAGKLHGPPEDCGGVGGFYNLLDAIADPAHEEHEELMEWIGGGFDPEQFSPAEVNRLLPRIQKRFRASPTADVKARKPKRKRTARHASDPLTLPSFLLNASQTPPRKRIRPDEKVPLDLNEHERELIQKHTSAPSALTSGLRIAPRPGESPAHRFTLGDLEELAGYIAFEANHAKDTKLGRQMHLLHARIMAVMESYTDQDE